VLSFAFALGCTHSLQRADAQRTLPVDVVAPPPRARTGSFDPASADRARPVRGPRSILDDEADDLGSIQLDLRSGRSTTSTSTRSL